MRTWLLQAGSNRYFTHNTYSQAVQLLPTCSHPESGHPRVNLTLTGLQKDLSIGLEHVPLLEVPKISFPLVLAHTRWYRKDVELEVVPRNQKTKMLRVSKVSACLCSRSPGLRRQCADEGVVEQAVPRFCVAQCTKGRAYAACEDVVRWCENCREWFHVCCLQQRDTVQFYRDEHAREPFTDFAPWVLWDTEQAVDPAVHAHFIGLITTPIQRCYPEVSPHHLLTAELFLQNVREAARRPRFALPPSKAEYRAFVDMLLVPTLVRPDIRAPKIDRFIEHLAQKALGEKMLYQCPLYADHVI